MMKILLLAAVAAFLFSRIGSAQDSSDVPYAPPPKAPYVGHTATKAAWVVEFTPKAAGTSPTGTGPGSQPPAKQLKQETWTKSGSVMECVTEWSDGSTTEEWVVGANLFSIDPVQKGVHLYSPKLNFEYHDYSTSEFGMLDWITAKDYDRVVKHGDDLCYSFSAKTLGTATTAAGPHNKTRAQISAPMSPTTVLISVQSGLPVEIDNGDGKYSFHYLPPPTEELKLPDAIATLLKSYH